MELLQHDILSKLTIGNMMRVVRQDTSLFETFSHLGWKYVTAYIHIPKEKHTLPYILSLI